MKMYRLGIPLLVGLVLAWLSIFAARAGEVAPEVRQTKFAPAPAPQFSLEPLQPETGLRILEENEQGITLELLTPDYTVETSEAEGRPCQVVRVDGYAETAQAGWPRLPLRGAMLGVPPETELKLTILEAIPQTAPGSYDLCPVAHPQADIDLESGAPTFEGYIAERDPRAYSMEIFTPTQAAEIVETAYIRSQRVAQLRFNPFQYNPSSGELRYYPRLRVRLEFGALARRPAAGLLPVVDEGAFETLLQTNLLNYTAARYWRLSPGFGIKKGVNVLLDYPYLTQPSFKILVDEDGIYQVSYDDLVNAGVEFNGIDPHTFQLFNLGQEVAISVTGEADGQFDPGDYIIFYGQETRTKFAKTNVYWLVVGNATGKRMSTIDVTPMSSANVSASNQNTLRIEKNLRYTNAYPSGPDKDHWLWATLTYVGNKVSMDFPFEFSHFVTDTPTATIRGLLKGFEASPYHHTQILLNGNQIDDAIWGKLEEHFFEVTVPISYLLDGANKITVQIPKDPSVSLSALIINWFEISYSRDYVAINDQFSFRTRENGIWEYHLENFSSPEIDVFDLSMPNLPVRLTGGVIDSIAGGYRLKFESQNESSRYLLAITPQKRLSPIAIQRDIPSNLHNTNNQADYIFITHENFSTDILPLVDYRSQQGLKTIVVKVQDVYDEFSFGIRDPEAIRQFLSYAYSAWNAPSVSYVLLVGDGHQDLRNYLNSGEPIFIPPYLADVDPWILETASDNMYARISGDDVLPDVFLGRLSVRNASELSAVISKILAYERDGTTYTWNNRALFVADNADTAGNFAYYSNLIADYHLPSEYSANKVYLYVTHGTVAAARAAVLNAINQGSLVVSYIGHGAMNHWASEQLLSKAAIANLTNAGKPAFMVPMTCLEGYFQNIGAPGQDYSTFAESIVRANNKGAIASFSPTGFGVASGHDILERGLFINLFANYITRLGPATTAAKINLFSQTSEHRDLIETYLLLGDPATNLQTLRPELRIQKTVTPQGALEIGDWVTYTLNYTNSGRRAATAVEIHDLLPTGLSNSNWEASEANTILRPGSQYIWDIDKIQPQSGGSITVRGQVEEGYAGLLTNRAEIRGLGDINLEDNVSQVSNPVSLPDLRLVKSALTNPPLFSGDAITYTLVYSNAGYGKSTHVIISDTIAAQLIDVNWISNGAVVTLTTGSRYVWEVEDLEAGQSGTITITGRISPGWGGLLTNVAEISGNGDYLIADNRSTVALPVKVNLYLPAVFSNQK